MAFAAVGFTVMIGALVLIAARSGRARSHLGASVFRIGNAKTYAGVVDRHGPQLFADLRGGNLDLYIEHLGDDRWAAFEAHVPSEDHVRCQLRWHADSREFTDPCTGRTFRPDGAGLPHFRVIVTARGTLEIDLSTIVGTSAEAGVPPAAGAIP